MTTPDFLKLQLNPTKNSYPLSKKDLIAAVMFFVLVLFIEGLIAFYWYDLTVFYQFNVIFDSDPNLWLRYHSEGGSAGTITHPLLAYYAFVPITVLSKIFSFLGIANLSELLAVWVSPLTAAVKSLLLFLTFRLLGMPLVKAAMVTIIGVLSFSSMVFGAVPSSYPFSGVMITAIYFFLALSLLFSRKASFLGMLVSGFLAIGVTTSNVAHLGWMLWAKFVAAKGSVFKSLLMSILVSFVVLIATLGTYVALLELRSGSFSSAKTLSYSKEFVDAHTPSLNETVINIARFPERAARTYVATIPEIKESRLQEEGTRYDFELTYNTINFDFLSFVLSVVAIGVVGGGFLIAMQLGGLWRLLGISSMLSFLTFWFLYSYFGYNTFLYSQHWQVTQLFFIAPWFATERFSQRWVLIAGGLVIALMIMLNVSVFSWIAQLLESV